MNQDEINQNEWRDPKNWSVLSYSSRLDSRLFVPKRRGFGETMNFGHKKARIVSLTFMGLILSSLIFALVDIAIKH